MGITKTKFMRGMQCRKMLWLDVHKKYLQIIPPEVQAIMDAGNEFGDRAMGMFGEYEEMTTYQTDGSWLDLDAMVGKTRIAVEKGVNVICEGGFRWNGNYCAVDILKKTDTGYDLYEVKDVDEVEEQFIRDTAFQLYILEKNHLNVGRVWIVTRGPDNETPYNYTEVTEQARGYQDWVDENLPMLNNMIKEEEEIVVTPGDQCSLPYECWYYGYCHGTMKDKGPHAKTGGKEKKTNSELTDLDDEYPVHSQIANGGMIPSLEGYPVIRRPAYSIVHEGPDDSEYCASSLYPEIYDDEYDCIREWYPSEEYYGFHPRLKYPDGYDG